MAATGANNDISTLLQQILTEVKSLKSENAQLSSAVDAITGRVNVLAGVKEVQGTAASATKKEPATLPEASRQPIPTEEVVAASDTPTEASPRRSSVTSKIILTSYPGQSGVDPLPMSWGHQDPKLRGPVVVSRHGNTIKKRNGKPVSAILILFTSRKVIVTELRSGVCVLLFSFILFFYSALSRLFWSSDFFSQEAYKRCSNWRPWWFVLNLLGAGHREQEPRYRPQTRLYQHGASCEYRTFPTMERSEEDCLHGSFRSSCTMAV